MRFRARSRLRGDCIDVLGPGSGPRGRSQQRLTTRPLETAPRIELRNTAKDRRADTTLNLRADLISGYSFSCTARVSYRTGSKPSAACLESLRDCREKGRLWLCPRSFKIREVSKVPLPTICDFQVVPHIVACTKQRPDALVRMPCYQTKR